MNIFTNNAVYATTILTALIDRYSLDILDWEPESIRLAVFHTYKTEIADVNMDKLMSAISLLTTDGFSKNINQFIVTCNAFSGTAIDMQTFDPATVEECAWGITEASLLDPENTMIFSTEISKYIGTRLFYEGWSKVPKVLSMAKLPVEEASAEEYSADPLFFSGIWAAIRENETQLEETLELNKRALLKQLAMLKLKQGSFQQLMTAMEKAHKRKDEAYART